MKIRKITVYEISIPLKFSISTAQATRKRSSNIILKMDFDNEEIGYGECIPRPYVTGETNESVQTMIHSLFIPLLIGSDINTVDDIRKKMDELESVASKSSDIFNGAALCAVDLAMLDGLGKSLNTPISTLLGGRARDCVVYSLGMDIDGIDKFEQFTKIIQQFRVRDFKVKVGKSKEDDLLLLKMIRERFGDNLDIRVDANCEWNRDEAINMIKEMEAYNISCVEQPIPQGDVTALKIIKENATPLLIADESACSFENVKELMAMQACDIVNVKVSKCGGLLNSLRIAQYVKENGKECILGAQIAETGILEASGRAFALLVENIRFCEGSISNFIFEENITKEDLSFNKDCQGCFLPGKGLGVSVDEGVLEKYLQN